MYVGHQPRGPVVIYLSDDKSFRNLLPTLSPLRLPWNPMVHGLNSVPSGAFGRRTGTGKEFAGLVFGLWVMR